MKKFAGLRFLSGALAVVLTGLPTTATACTACLGETNSKTAGAMNAAIFLMLGFIGGVLGLLVAFGLTLMKRASAPPPAHSEFSQDCSDASATF